MEGGVTFRRFHTVSRAHSGSITTPYFGQPFDENSFELLLTYWYVIHVPNNIAEGTKIVFNIEYDMEQTSHSENWKIQMFESNKVTEEIGFRVEKGKKANDTITKEFIAGKYQNGKM